MAFEKGVAQTVGLVTMSGSAPTAPSGNILAEVSVDGAAFATATNALTSVDAGACLLALTAAETNGDTVQVRVSSDATDTLIQTFYFEDAYTAAKAAYIDAAISSRATDAELTAAHGSGAWNNAGIGANEVTITVTDGSVGLPNISVTIRNTAGTTLVAGPLATDADGAVAFNLDDGDYKAIPATMAHYSGGSTEFTVASAALAVTCAMTAATIPASTDPELCTVYGDLRGAGGVLLGEGGGSITVIGVPYAQPVANDDSIIGYSAADTAATNAAGRAEIELIRGVEYTLEVDNGLTTRTVSLTVPDAASYNLNALL